MNTDQSIFTNSHPKEISEGLQNFIDSMVEEIVSEGKPFDSQKKYLKKFSEKDGIDYNKLETDINTFLEILESLKFAFNKLQAQLAEEKGRECHISENTIKKLIKYSSKPKQTKANNPVKEKRMESHNKLPYKKYGFYGIICLILLGLAYFLLPLFNRDNGSSPLEHQDMRIDTVVVVKRDTIVKIQYSTEAEQKYRAKAERGDASAQFSLGCYYYSGEKGLQQDYSEAVKWYTKAANQGYAPAQNNLGYCYEKGYGVDVDSEKAKYWYQKATDQGDKTARKNLKRIEIQDRIVDLGLPSGLKWAKFNMGATSESDMGKIMKYDNFIQEMALKEGDSSVWRLPQRKDFVELFSCKWDWTEKTSNNGARITGFTITGHNGKKMFLPFPKYKSSAKNTIINHYLLDSNMKETHWINLMYDTQKDKLNYMYILNNGNDGFVRMVRN